jgi:hypothetical protein
MTWRDKAAFLRRRLSRYGLLRVVDEILFKIFYTLFLKRADDRIRRTLAFDRGVTKERLERQIEVHEVTSLNGVGGRGLLRRLQPDLVIIVSREMIRGETLGAATLGFVGCHPGLLREYRGVYAPFWAMRLGAVCRHQTFTMARIAVKRNALRAVKRILGGAHYQKLRGRIVSNRHT